MTFHKGLFAGVVGILIASALACAAQASIITYSNKAAFLAATGAANAVGGPLPELGIIGSGSQTLGSITYSVNPITQQLIIGGCCGVSDWTTLHPGADVAISGFEDLDLTAGAPVFAMGFDFVEPSLGGSSLLTPGTTCDVPVCTDSTFTVTMKNGASIVDSFTFNATDDTLAFVGVWSTAAFDKFEIRETIGGIDDEYYGEVYTGAKALPTGVPEPATLALFGVGLAGLGAMRRRRKAKA